MALDEARQAEIKGENSHSPSGQFIRLLMCYIAKLKERDDWIRESWVRAMEARIVQNNLQKCYRVEGVNHLEKCKHLAEQYTEMLKENRVSSRSTPYGFFI